MPLKHAERLRTYYSNDCSPDALAIDNGSTQRFATEIKVGSFLIDYADTAFIRYSMPSELLASR